jgi:hypothetical protein
VTEYTPEDLRRLIAKLLKQQKESQLYIHRLSSELLQVTDDRDRLQARVRELEAAATGCIPVEIVDAPTVNRRRTREVQS